MDGIGSSVQHSNAVPLKSRDFPVESLGKRNVDVYGYQSDPNSMPNTTVTENSVNSAPSANLSQFIPDTASGIPAGPPELSVTEASLKCEFSSAEISFLGKWSVQMLKIYIWLL